MPTIAPSTPSFKVKGHVGVVTLNVVQLTGETIPQIQLQDALKLTADAYIDFYQITLSNNSATLYLKLNDTLTWQGNTYEGTGIQLEGLGNYASQQVARPKLTLFNPLGIYSSFVDQGLIDGAKVVRYRVLKEHADQNLAIYRRQQWRVSRVISLKLSLLVVELRNMLDGQTFLTPARMYIPPDFPVVSLQ